MLMAGYLTLCSLSSPLAESHFGIAFAEVVVFRYRLVAPTVNHKVTRCLILVVHSLHGLLLDLQNGQSLTSCRGLLLFVGKRQKVPKK